MVTMKKFVINLFTLDLSKPVKIVTESETVVKAFEAL